MKYKLESMKLLTQTNYPSPVHGYDIITYVD